MVQMTMISVPHFAFSIFVAIFRKDNEILLKYVEIIKKQNYKNVALKFSI